MFLFKHKSTNLQDQRSPRRQAIPPDNPFLENLFANICQDMVALPNESFVGRARRWTYALIFLEGLQPSTQQEWVQAAEVTRCFFAGVYSLIMSQLPGNPAKRRAHYKREYQTYIKATCEAARHYNELR